MKRLTIIAVFGLGWALTAAAAEERFSQAVRPEDFSAAGLGKLSPAEIERLDALVREFKARAVEVARSEAAPSSPAPSNPTAKTVAPVQKKTEGGLLAKAKVILAPGTEIEYSNVDSRLVGEFRGWQAKTVFTLENGQRWQVAGGDGYVGPPIPSPAVKITPGMLGTFWMNIEGVNRRVKVTLISTQ